MSDQDRSGSGGDTKVRKRTDRKTTDPGKWKVVLHNDDYTTMELVVEILMTIFKKDRPAATQIMLTVHHRGAGVCGVYSRDVAETKVTETLEFAQEHGAPLLCTAEPL